MSQTRSGYPRNSLSHTRTHIITRVRDCVRLLIAHAVPKTQCDHTHTHIPTDSECRMCDATAVSTLRVQLKRRHRFASCVIIHVRRPSFTRRCRGRRDADKDDDDDGDNYDDDDATAKLNSSTRVRKSRAGVCFFVCVGMCFCVACGWRKCLSARSMHGQRLTTTTTTLTLFRVES